jgi:hypothetical protein
VLAVICVDFLINKTVLGYEMRAVGLNRDAAETAGINPKKNIILALVFAGALAGFGGAGEILGYHHYVSDDWSVGLGWDGITVAVLGNNSPWGILAGAIFFGALRAGGNQMQRIAGVPIEMVSLIQGLIVLFVAAPRAIEWLSERGFDYAVWLKEDKVPASIHLWITCLAGFSAVFCLTVAGSYSAIFEASVPGGGIFVGLLLFITSLVSFYTLIELLTRKPRGPLLGVFISVAWFIVLAIGLLAASMIILTQSFIFASLFLVLSIILMKLLPRGKYIPGGVEV